MARVSLKDSLKKDQVQDAPEAAIEASAAETAPPAPVARPVSQAARGKAPASVPVVRPSANVDKLERKEARLRPEQYADLTEIARGLVRTRKDAGVAGERITENTLIRVAIDLLLSRRGDLSGYTEEELLASVRK